MAEKKTVWLVWDNETRQDFILHTANSQAEADDWAEEHGGFVEGPYTVKGEALSYANSKGN